MEGLVVSETVVGTLWQSEKSDSTWEQNKVLEGKELGQNPAE
jgi:hypothetical protein